MCSVLDVLTSAGMLWGVLTCGVIVGWGLCCLMKACTNDPSTQRLEDDLQAAVLAGESFELEAGLLERSVQAFKAAPHERAPKGYVRGQAEPIYGCIDCNDPKCPQNKS